MVKIRFKQSRNWWIEKDLKWIIDNASFVFRGAKDGGRLRIVTKEKMGTSNCFKIDNDKFGILINAHSEYSDFSYLNPDTMSNVKYRLIEFLEDYGAGEFVSPPILSVLYGRILNMFRKKKDKYLMI